MHGDSLLIEHLHHLHTIFLYNEKARFLLFCLIAGFLSLKKNLLSIFQKIFNFTEQMEVHFVLSFKNTFFIQDVHINIHYTENIAALKFNILLQRKYKKKEGLLRMYGLCSIR